MLEMDLLLGNFLDNHFSKLTPGQAAAFTVLADMEDINLWPLITGKQESDDPLEAEVLALLRKVRVK